VEQNKGRNMEIFFRYTVEQSNRAVLYLLAITGIISAACLSGLPSTSCYALADAYALILQFFGAFFILDVIFFYVLSMIQYKIGKNSFSIREKISYIILSIIAIFICLLPIVYAAENGASNIRLAIDNCLRDTTQQNHYNRILLYRSLFSHVRS
jgi:hypothetical protein